MGIGIAQTGAMIGGLAADSHSLDGLSRLAGKDPAKAVTQVSKQFEALFLQSVLKSMREATMKSGLLDSSEQDTYQQMLDTQLAQTIAQNQGTGLARMIARQLRQGISQADGGPTAAGPHPAPSSGAAPRGAPAMLQVLQAAVAIQGPAKNAVNGGKGGR